MAIVHSKYGRACPQCGSVKVLKPRLGYGVEGARAKCQACGFLIFKTNKKIALEAVGTLLLVISLIFAMGKGFTEYRYILLSVAVLGLVMTYWSYRLSDTTETIESGIHKLLSRVVGYGKYIVFALIAVFVVR